MNSLKLKKALRIDLSDEQAEGLWLVLQWARGHGFDAFTENAIKAGRGANVRIAAAKVAVALGRDPAS